MTIENAYRILLRLYPADFRVSFSAEMLDTFLKAAEKRRARGRLSFMRFVFAEMIGVPISAVSESISKLTTDRSVRGRVLPDLRRMRPPGVPQRLWFAEASAGHNASRLQDEVVETQKRIDGLIGYMVDAIAHHDFPKARAYSDQESAAANIFGVYKRCTAFRNFRLRCRVRTADAGGTFRRGSGGEARGTKNILRNIYAGRHAGRSSLVRFFDRRA